MLLDTPFLLGFPILLTFYWFLPYQRAVKLPLSMSLWALAHFFLFASQDFWISSARYVALVLPLCVMVEDLVGDNKLLYGAGVGLSAGLAVYVIYLFTWGGWLF
jgi:hypothetical protein